MKKYDSVILINSCESLTKIVKEEGIELEDFPFDNVFSLKNAEDGLEKFYEYLKNNFKDFLHKEDLFGCRLNGNKKAFLNSRNQFIITDRLFNRNLSQWNDVIDDYERRIINFFNKINESETVLFVYYCEDNDINMDTHKFNRVMREEFPYSVIDLLIIRKSSVPIDAVLDIEECKLDDHIKIINYWIPEELKKKRISLAQRSLLLDIVFSKIIVKRNFSNNKIPKVSVVLPTFNSVQYISATLNSILSQTYQNFEVLVIDDGSTDGTREIVKNYEELDSRILLVEGPRRGLSAALNLGIELANGKYIARVDADDYCVFKRFEKQVYELERRPYLDIVGSWQEHYWADNWIHKCPENVDIAKGSLLFSCDLCHSTLMLRRKTFIDLGLRYPINSMQEDFELWNNSLNKIKFCSLPEILGFHRVHKGSISEIKGQRLSDFQVSIVKHGLKKYFDIDIDGGYDIVLRRRDPYYDKLTYDGKCHFQQKLDSLYKLIENSNNFRKFLDPKSLHTVLQLNWSIITNGENFVDSDYYRKSNLSKIKRLLPFLPLTKDVVEFDNCVKVTYNISKFQILKTYKGQNIKKRYLFGFIRLQ